jgi:hypothetical protein
MIPKIIEPRNTGLSLAIWECSYLREKQGYKDLIIKKALRLKDLEAIDLFSIPENQAKSVTRQMEYLTGELNILYGFKLFTDQLEKSYHDSIEQIYEAYHSRNLLLELELFELYKACAYLQDLQIATIDNVSFMTDLAIKKTEQIITLKQQP